MPFRVRCVVCLAKVRMSKRLRRRSTFCPRCGSKLLMTPCVPVRKPAPAASSSPPPISEPEPAPPVLSLQLPAPELEPPPVAPPAPDTAAAPKAAPAAASIVLSPAIFSTRGTAALVFASLGLVCVSFPVLRLLTLLLTGLALACAMSAWKRSPSRDRKAAVLPAIASLLSLPVLLLAAFWPYLLATTPPSGPPAESKDDPLRVRAVAVGGSIEEETPEWIDAHTHSAQQGDLRVRVLSGEVRAANPGRSRQRFLNLTLRIYNVGTTRTLDYPGWGEAEGPSEKQAVLRDDHGKNYRLCSFAQKKGSGQAHPPAIGPLKKVVDVLVFEAPPADVEQLYLELPTVGVGGEGVLPVKVPRSMIVRR